MSDDLLDLLKRIASGKHFDTDRAALRRALQSKEGRSLSQLSKYNIIGEGKDIQIGDRIDMKER